jgi:hypothetical protein
LQLQPTIVDPDSTQLQILELIGQPVRPTNRAIEQLLSKQLLKFVFEECAENNASGPLLHLTGKFDIKITLAFELDRAVGLDYFISRLDCGGVWQSLILTF